MRIAVGVVLAVAALVVAGCGSKSQSLPKPPQTAVMKMTIKNGKPVGGIERFTVEKGKPLSIVVYSDVADEVHLHGYDKHVDVAPGPDPSIIHFDPEIPGVFVIELENRGLQIGELTVK
jgi:hypothetical protein